MLTVLEMPMRKRIVIALEAEEYAALTRLGERACRDPWQECYWLLRRAIAAEQQAGERAEADDARPA